MTGEEFKVKLKAFLIAHWKIIAGAVVTIITFGFVCVTFDKIAEVVERITKKSKFVKIIGDETKVLVTDESGKDTIVKLPDGVKSSQVVAAGVTDAGKIQVEVLHEKVDRAHPGDAVAGNALDSLRERSRQDPG